MNVWLLAALMVCLVVYTVALLFLAERRDIAREERYRQYGYNEGFLDGRIQGFLDRSRSDTDR